MGMSGHVTDAWRGEMFMSVVSLAAVLWPGLVWSPCEHHYIDMLPLNKDYKDCQSDLADRDRSYGSSSSSTLTRSNCF